jgi:hypothetical protein
MTGIFWLGIALGAVAGIILEFMARPIQRFADRRIETRARVHGEKLRREKAGNREAIRDFLVLQILEISLITAITGIVSGVLFAAASYPAAFSSKFAIAGQLVAITGGIIILRIAGDAILIARAARSSKEKPTN